MGLRPGKLLSQCECVKKWGESKQCMQPPSLSGLNYHLQVGLLGSHLL